MDRDKITDQFIDWSSAESHLLLNPKRPEANKNDLSLSNLPALPAHIWVSSSNSAFYGLSKTAFLVAAEAANAHLQATAFDIWLNVLPTFHVGGLSIFARAHLAQAKVIDRSRDSWSAEKFHLWVNDSRATLTSLVPTQIYDLVKLDCPAPSSLRAIVVGGARLDTELYVKARALGFRVLPSYGMTECCSQVATATLESLDKPMSHFSKDDSLYPRLQVLSHVEAQRMNDGFLSIRSPALFTAKAVWKGHMEVLWRSGQWYVTPDLAEVHTVDTSHMLRKLQYILPQGRGQEQIKVSGEMVNLLELNTLMNKIASPNSYVFSQNDQRRGSEVAAVFLASDFALAEKWITNFNKQVLPVSKICAAYFLRELPRTELGKIKSAELKAQLRLT